MRNLQDRLRIIVQTAALLGNNIIVIINKVKRDSNHEKGAVYDSAGSRIGGRFCSPDFGNRRCRGLDMFLVHDHCLVCSDGADAAQAEKGCR